MDHILKREAYIGRYAQIRHKRVHDDSRANGYRRVKLPKSEWIYVDVPPIIDERTWMRAQDKLHKRRGKTKRKLCDYPLTGRLNCECGYAMVGHSATWRLKSGEKRYTRYYLCKAHSNRYALRRCEAKNINADKLESAVWNWAMHLITNPEFLRELHACSIEKIREEAQPDRERLAAFSLEKMNAEKRLRRLARLMLAASEVEQSVYKPEIDKLRNSIAYLTGLINDYEGRLRDSQISQEQANDLLQHLEALKDSIRTQANDLQFQKQVINALDLHVTVTTDRQTASIECAIGQELVNLYEDGTDGDFCVTNASHTRCTGRMPARRGPRRVPIPDSRALGRCTYPQRRATPVRWRACCARSG